MQQKLVCKDWEYASYCDNEDTRSDIFGEENIDWIKYYETNPIA